MLDLVIDADDDGDLAGTKVKRSFHERSLTAHGFSTIRTNARIFADFSNTQMAQD